MSSSIVIPTHFDLVDEKTRKHLNVFKNLNLILIEINYFIFVILIIILLLLLFFLIFIYYFRLLGPCRRVSTTRI